MRTVPGPVLRGAHRQSGGAALESGDFPSSTEGFRLTFLLLLLIHYQLVMEL